MGAGDQERWNEKWSAAGVGTSHGSKLVDLLAQWLPSTGRLLDIAGGGSTDAIALAEQGLDVTVCDVSDVGLAVAQRHAGETGVAIETVQRDLEAEPLPPGPWTVITVANYLQRDLLPAMTAALEPGGLLGVVIATATNLERNEHPRAQFLLAPGELPGLLGPRPIEILHHSEEWRDNGRHEAHLVVRAAS